VSSTGFISMERGFLHAGWVDGLGGKRGRRTGNETNTDTKIENTHPSQNRRRMGHPQRLGQESQEWSSGIIRVGMP
jgi:hypothetical protein